MTGRWHLHLALIRCKAGLSKTVLGFAGVRAVGFLCATSRAIGSEASSAKKAVDCLAAPQQNFLGGEQQKDKKEMLRMYYCCESRTELLFSNHLCVAHPRLEVRVKSSFAEAMMAHGQRSRILKRVDSLPKWIAEVASWRASLRSAFKYLGFCSALGFRRALTQTYSQYLFSSTANARGHDLSPKVPALPVPREALSNSQLKGSYCDTENGNVGRLDSGTKWPGSRLGGFSGRGAGWTDCCLWRHLHETKSRCVQHIWFFLCLEVTCHKTFCRLFDY